MMLSQFLCNQAEGTRTTAPSFAAPARRRAVWSYGLTTIVVAGWIVSKAMVVPALAFSNSASRILHPHPDCAGRRCFATQHQHPLRGVVLEATDLGPVAPMTGANGSHGSHSDRLEEEGLPSTGEEDSATCSSTSIASSSSTSSSSSDDARDRETPTNAPLIVDDSMPNDYRYSASDWWHNIRSVPRSSILQAIKVPVLAVSIWSTLVSLVYNLLRASVGDVAASRLCISTTLHSCLVSALGLLLVFRTNSAYSRFNEGRTIWERIHTISRNLSRMAVLYEPELGIDRRRRVLRLLAAFPYLLHHHIQPHGDPNLEGTPHGVAAYLPSQPLPRVAGRRGRTSKVGATTAMVDPVLSSGNGRVCWVDQRHLPWNLFPHPALHQCLQAANRPLWVCDKLSAELNRVSYTPNFTSRERLAFFSQLDKLSQCVGECERIHQTAVPLNYARHSLRSLTVWLFTLPFGLVQDWGWGTGPVMGLTAWLLYGIYQIGYQIEDPFAGSLRLNALCDAVYRDVLDGNWVRRRATAFADDSREEIDAWRALDEPLTTAHPPLPGSAAAKSVGGGKFGP